MSNGNYPSPEVAYQGVHALLGYGVVLSAGFRLDDWTTIGGMVFWPC